MVVDLSSEIGVILLRVLEHDLDIVIGIPVRSARSRRIPLMYLGPIGEFVCGQIDLPKGPFPDQPPQGVVSD